MAKVYIIAEAGVNHNGDLALAKELVQRAASSGADAIKFQSFKADFLATNLAPQAKYQEQNMRKKQSQYELLKALELSKEAHFCLFAQAKACKIDFLSSVFDLPSLRLLEEMGLNTLKIPSGELTNLPLLRAIGKLNKRLFISTGMSDLAEVKTAISILSKAGTKKDKMIILHANTQYPTPMCDVNLRAMKNMGEALNLDFGYSDHTLGSEVAVAAVALGACVIEKHLSLDTSMKGPDHKASANPRLFSLMVKQIKNIELALGDGNKRCSKSEEANKKIVRKVIVALKDIEKDELLSCENIGVKRAGDGVSAMLWDDFLGKRALKAYKKDESIKL